MKKNALLLLFSILLLSCSKNKSDFNSIEDKENRIEIKKIKETENNNLLYKISKLKPKKPRKFRNGERASYNKALNIVSKKNDLNLSYFDSNNLDSIYLRIPVPNENFGLHEVYNISKGKNKGIVLVVSDITENSSCNKKIEFMLDEKLSASSIYELNNSRNTLKLNKKDQLYIFVLNEYLPKFQANRFCYIQSIKNSFDDGTIFNGECEEYEIMCLSYDKNNNFTPILLVRPQEGGGGVIISNP